MTKEQALLTWAKGKLNREFEWGVTDCALLALEAVDLYADRQLAAIYRRAWTTQAEALDYFANELPSQVLARAGAVEVPANYVAIGDLLTVPAPPWPEQLHVVLGRFCLCASPERGVHLAPARVFYSQPNAKGWRLDSCRKPSL